MKKQVKHIKSGDVFEAIQLTSFEIFDKIMNKTRHKKPKHPGQNLYFGEGNFELVRDHWTIKIPKGKSDDWLLSNMSLFRPMTTEEFKERFEEV